jgi:phosphate transport system substrate-binding protein
MPRKLVCSILLVAVLFVAAFAQDLKGAIKIDGSSTVYPVTSAVAEEFMSDYPGVKVTVGISGTGGGFKKFGAGETDISDASRPIKQTEADLVIGRGDNYIELPVAYDGLAVMVNPKNDWVDHLTVAELKAISGPESKIKNWSQVRKGFPDVPLSIYSPGADSGTFDYYTEAIVGESGAHRSDVAAFSEDDNVLVSGIAGDKGAIGYFGYAYYVHNKEKLKLVPVKNGDSKPVAPSPTTINNGTYQPLSRPIFIYVSTSAAKRAEVNAFIKYYLENADWIVPEAGYIELPAKVYEVALANYGKKVTGSAFHGGGATVGVDLAELLSGLGAKH